MNANMHDTTDEKFPPVGAEPSSLFLLQYFVEILKAKGTLRQDIRESIFTSIKAIHSVNQ